VNVTILERLQLNQAECQLGCLSTFLTRMAIRHRAARKRRVIWVSDAHGPEFTRSCVGQRIPAGYIDRLIEGQAHAVSHQVGLNVTDVRADDATADERATSAEQEMDVEMRVGQQTHAPFDQCAER